MITAMSVVGCALYLAIVAALIQKYRTTRDREFIWLSLPLAIGPLLGLPLSHLLKLAVDRLSSGECVGFYPFTLVEQGQMSLGGLMALLSSVQHIVWLGLILTAILMLHRSKRGETASPA
jgi:hypothetical protein